MIPGGSIDDFGGALEGPAPLESWECPAEFRFSHEAVKHETTTEHTVCEPKDSLESTPADVRSVSISRRGESAVTSTAGSQAGQGDVAPVSTRLS